MRYKVKAPSRDAFVRVRHEVAESQTPVFVVSERRLSLSTGELSSKVQRRIEKLGATIQEEYQFGTDAAFAPT